jgi:uncharacterized protein (DUF305 family)
MTLRFGVLVAATALVLGGCVQVVMPHSPGYRTSSAASYSATDIMFAQMMIPHHQQAIDMSELALEKSSDPEIVALATDIKAAQGPEIEQMTAWLTDAGASLDGGDHAGHMNMGGMLTDQEMQRLTTATGAEFDRLFLEGMIIHHEGAIMMARMIQDSANPEVQALSVAITTAQRQEIDLMRQLLAR